MPAALVFAAGCSLFGTKPTDQVNNFFSTIRAGNYNGAIELISPDLRDKMRGSVSDLTTGANEWASSNYEVKDASITGDKATVTVELVDGKTQGMRGEPVTFGSRQEIRFYLTKIGKRWYIEGISN